MAALVPYTPTKSEANLDVTKTMKFKISRRKLLGTFVAGIAVQGCGGTSGKDLQSSNGVEAGLTLRGLLGQTIYIAHRGSAALYPEETYVAYDGSLKDRQLLLECDVQMLGDGALGIMHDSTVDRTTTSKGNVGALTETEWRNLRVDGDVWHGSAFGNDLAAPLFADWLQKYRGRAILVPEDKDLRSMPTMLSALSALKVASNQVLIQCFSVEPLALAVAAGYEACFLHYGSANPAISLAAGIKWAGIAATASDAELLNWVASGTNVFVWTVNRRYERDLKLALGVRGFFSDDPSYLSGHVPLTTTDRFDLQTWMPGMLGSLGGVADPSRGNFFDGSYWGYTTPDSTYMGCLHGYLCPIKGQARPGAYAIAFNVKFEFARDNDDTRWASLFIGTDDRPFLDGDENTSGYHVLFRKNGVIEIYKKAPNVKATLLGMSNGGAPIPNGAEVTFRVTVTETTIKVARVYENGSEQYVTTVEDRSFRGAYLQLGRSGLACKFRAVSIT